MSPTQAATSSIYERLQKMIVPNTLENAIVSSCPHMGSSSARSEAYDLAIQEIKTEALQEASSDLIDRFNVFCYEHDKIEYFAIAKTLAGAIAYNDFIPNTTLIEVGMTRPEYLKLEKAFADDEADARKLGIELKAFGDIHPNVRRMLPKIVLTSPKEVEIDGKVVFSSDHMPMLANPYIEISIMDEIPDDYDLSRVFFKWMKLVNNKAEKKYGKSKHVSNEAWKMAGRYTGTGQSSVGRVLYKRSAAIPVADIYPIKYVKFGATEIACPNNTSTWIEENRERELAQVRILQKDALAIACEIDRVCRENNIGYFICGGTMLGLVRHQGFIPWDDDMDIGMLRSDYEKFIDCAKSQLSDRFFLQTRETDPNIPYLFSKVRLKNSSYITKYNELRDFNKGICVDIFPFDKVPDNRDELLAFKRQVNAQFRIHKRIANGQIPDAMTKSDDKSLEATISRTIMGVRHKKFWDHSLAETQKNYDATVTKYNDGEYRYVASFVPTYTMVRIDDLLPYQDVEFDGQTLMAPAKPEIFLQMQYGDYMSMPMPHQQHGHGLLWWSNENVDSRELNEEGLKDQSPDIEKLKDNAETTKEPFINDEIIDEDTIDN